MTLQEMIEQIDTALPDADALVKVGEAQRRARALNDVGDQLVDHYVAQARAKGASWSQIGDALGVSKQAAQQRRSGNQFERFTGRARNLVVVAEGHARKLRQPAVTTEHLLLALIESEGLGAMVIAQLAGPLDAVADAVTAGLTPGTGAQQPVHVPFAEDCKRVFEETVDQALGLGHNYVGTEHILLGIMKVPDCRAAEVLSGMGADYDRARDMVTGMLIGYQAARGAKKPKKS